MNSKQVVREMAVVAARNLTDSELCEQAVILAIYARVIHEECERRSKPDLLHREPAGHA